jgi:threonine aldolase
VRVAHRLLRVRRPPRQACHHDRWWIAAKYGTTREGVNPSFAFQRRLWARPGGSFGGPALVPAPLPTTVPATRTGHGYARQSMPQPIDLRSDTVTQPSPEMRRAMAEAELGDDVFGDDPTVIALEERAAEITGKEAGLFVASGTMGNLVSEMAHVPRGGEIICGEGGHTMQHEAANHAVVVGASMWTLPWGPDGRMDLDDIRNAFRDPTDVHDPITSLVVVENTHSDSMAQPLPVDYMAAVAGVAHDGGVPLHVDGARIFNAAVALGTSVKALLADADSASFCLSKGLACPVGSVVVGGRDFIWRARRARKLLGGGMRQAGVLAAPGIVALRDGADGMIDRLAEDHANARRLADGLVQMAGVTGLDPSRARTNFVLFRVARPGAQSASDATRPEALRLRQAFLDELAQDGVLMVAYPHGQIRAVTHYGIETADIERTLQAVRRTLSAVGVAPMQVLASAARERAS